MKRAILCLLLVMALPMGAVAGGSESIETGDKEYITVEEAAADMSAGEFAEQIVGEQVYDKQIGQELEIEVQEKHEGLLQLLEVEGGSSVAFFGKVLDRWGEPILPPGVIEVVIDGVVKVSHPFANGEYGDPQRLVLQEADFREATEIWFKIDGWLAEGVQAIEWATISGEMELDLQVDWSEDECFIATAAYGSKLEPSVVVLRQFRDRFLLTNKFGQAFVNFYYQHSPRVARTIAQSEMLKIAVRVLLVPVVGIAYLVLHFQLGLALFFLAGRIIYWGGKKKG